MLTAASSPVSAELDPQPVGLVNVHLVAGGVRQIERRDEVGGAPRAAERHQDRRPQPVADGGQEVERDGRHQARSEIRNPKHEIRNK